MKIPARSADGQNHEIETNSLNDVYSEVLEKSEELKNLCHKYGINFALAIEGRDAFRPITLVALKVEGNAQRIVDFWHGLNRGLKNKTNQNVNLQFNSNEN